MVQMTPGEQRKANKAIGLGSTKLGEGLAIACGWVWYRDNEKLVANCAKLYKSLELG